MAAHVGYESWLERDQALLLDFDCEVVAFAAQPFRLLFTGETGPRSHAPEFFARRRDGSAVVIDCRPDDRIRSRDAESFAATARACDLAGWNYQRNGAAEPMVVENVRWLSGYRHPRHADEAMAARLIAEFAGGRPLADGAQAAGPSIVTLPVLFHSTGCRRYSATHHHPCKTEPSTTPPRTPRTGSALTRHSWPSPASPW
ncbi:MAG: hypothetical protein DLM58_21780 [Pseudonocardiales bacterium]|nr:MAG: hypothetical protein DLM58_21780 [Pseudonocardiales bacterium]